MAFRTHLGHGARAEGRAQSWHCLLLCTSSHPASEFVDGLPNGTIRLRPCLNNLCAGTPAQRAIAGTVLNSAT